MSDAATARASVYERLVDDSAKQKMSLAQFQSMSETITSKLGTFSTLDTATRTEIHSASAGFDVSTAYTAHFSKGDAVVSLAFSNAHDRWRIVRFGLNSPLLSSDPASHPQNIELYVSNSDVIMPGSHAKIVASQLGDKVLVQDAVVLNVRWKVSLSGAHEGFVTVALTPSEMESVKGVENLALKASN